MSAAESTGEAAPAPMRAEERVFFEGDSVLEGMLGRPEPSSTAALPGVRLARGGVVVAHPYPPHGANMDLPLVRQVAKACRQRHFASLRFNFRSTGQSGGTFSGTEEDRDVAAAVAFMGRQLDAAGDTAGVMPPLGLAGWSFGSVMAARAAADLPQVHALALVGFVPGWEHMPADTLDRLARYRGPVLAVCAEKDDIGSPADVEAVLAGLGADFTLKVVRDADHFLQGRHREVASLVADFIDVSLMGGVGRVRV